MLFLIDTNFSLLQALTALLADDSKFGFIVMDGNGALFGTLSGNTREVLHKFTVDLPKKHGRGGQSALRFARLRLEKRHNYVRKVAETAVQLFITNDRPNVEGLVLAGSADFKTELSQSDMFDQRLQAKIIKVVDVSYGGENGFNQAIDLASDSLANVKFIQEKKLIGKYFDEISQVFFLSFYLFYLPARQNMIVLDDFVDLFSFVKDSLTQFNLRYMKLFIAHCPIFSQDTERYCFGVDDTLKALEMGAVDILIVWENLSVTRYVLKNHTTDGELSIAL